MLSMSTTGMPCVRIRVISSRRSSLESARYTSGPGTLQTGKEARELQTAMRTVIQAPMVEATRFKKTPHGLGPIVQEQHRHPRKSPYRLSHSHGPEDVAEADGCAALDAYQ